MVKINFTPIDYDYFDFGGRNYAKITGRSDTGKRITIIDTCDIYIWAILQHELSDKVTKKLMNQILNIEVESSGRKTKVEKVELHDKKFLEAPVKAIKIFINNYKDAPDIADKLNLDGIEKRREHDLNFITKYILDRGLTPMNWYEIEGEILSNSEKFGGIDAVLNVDMVLDITKKPIKEIIGNENKNFEEDELAMVTETSHCDVSTKRDFKTKGGRKFSEENLGGHHSNSKKYPFNFTPKVLAFDIETDAFEIGKGEILMIALKTENFEKVITHKKSKTNSKNILPYVEYVKDEADLIEKFVEYVKKISPDFITGYFSDGFDMPYLKARAEKNNVKLDISLDGTQPKFSRGATMVARTQGIVHIDLFKFIRTAYAQYLESETLSLNDVANALLKDNKKEFDIAKHLDPNEKYADWNAFFEYNLQDTELTYRLFEKSWQDLQEFTKVIKEPIFEISRNGMSKNVESFIIHNLARFNEIIEKRPTHSELGKRRHRERYEGAYVFQPTPGLYENIAMFDFTSYWPSIIVSFNLSRSTYFEKKPKSDKDLLEVKISGGQRLFFSEKKGFFPTLLEEIIKLRKKYKQELAIKEDPIKRARSNAFKVLANSAYGYQGFFGARYYCPEASAATTAISREYIQKIIAQIDKEGFKTIYSDTDSIAFLLNKKTKKDALNFVEKVNEKLPGIMEFELEAFYKRGLWVTTRGGEFGAKKKYAQLSESGKLKVRGFETVRRDWCKLARELQNEVIKKVLEDGNEKGALEIVKKIIKQLKSGEAKLDKLIIKTQLKKPLSDYKAISPHVVAARKMKEAGLQVGMGTLIEYYVADTETKQLNSKGKKAKQLVRERVKLPSEKGEYDISYYLENQILPAVENIFQVFNIDTQELIDGKKQSTLQGF